MRIIKKFRIRMIIGSILGIALLLVVTIFVFINQPSFGRNSPRRTSGKNKTISQL